MSAGPTETKQTTTHQLSPEQQEILGLALPGVRQFAAKVPERYQGNRVAGFTPEQQSAQEMALGAAGAQRGVADTARGTSDFYLGGDIWNPASNPNLQGAIDASTRPIRTALTEEALPAIRGEAVTTGNFGSSRQGIAEGQATGRASQAIGDTASKIVQDQYKTNVQAQMQALGLAPQTQQLQLSPAMTTGAVGDIRQGMDQRLIDQQIENFNYGQYAPFLQSQELVSLISGIPGGSVTSTAPLPRPGMSQALGGAAAGASLGSALLPGFGTAAGAGLGALMPFLFR